MWKNNIIAPFCNVNGTGVYQVEKWIIGRNNTELTNSSIEYRNKKKMTVSNNDKFLAWNYMTY